MLSSLVFDFVVRQKLGGINFTYGYFKQIAGLAPSVFSISVQEKIIPRVLELTFTAYDLSSFYADIVEANSSFDTRPASEHGQLAAASAETFCAGTHQKQ